MKQKKERQLKKILIALITVSAALAFPSCKTDHGPEGAKVRYVYYNSAANDSTAGVFRVNIDTDVRERIFSMPVAYTTAVAENGVVLFQTADASFELKGKCTTGAIVPVPFPVPDDVRFEYRFAIPPFLTLSAPGHHALYPITLTGANPPTSEACFALFNCSTQKMTIVNVDSAIRKILVTKQVQDVRVYGDRTLINRDGDRFWFVAAITSTGTQGLDSLYCIAEWNAGTIHIISKPSTALLRLRGYNHFAEELFVLNETDDRISMFSISDGVMGLTTTLSGAQLQSPLQCSTDGEHIAVWGADAIELFHTASNRLTPLVSRSDVTRLSAGGATVFKNSGRLSMSPDGEWITFALPRAENPELYNIFIVRRDGTWLQRVASNVSCSVPVISNDVDPL